MKGLFSTLCAAVVGLTSEAFALDRPAAEETFKQCAACHAIGVGAGNKVGPNLNGIAGRRAGAVDGYRYSEAVKRAGENGLVWNVETLNGYLAEPREYLKGARMGFVGLEKPDERANLVAWLASFGADGETVPNDSGEQSELLGAAAAELTGDAEYGEYIAGECVTCHRPSGGADGIPLIVGWPTEHFIHALYEYKTGVRENPVMQTVTIRLGDEEMAALAAYFGTLQPD